MAHSIAGEGPQLGVVGAHRLDVVAPRDGDAVLGALELRLQRQEVLVRFQVGIVLAHREQPPERARELVLRVLELLQLLGIGELRGVDVTEVALARASTTAVSTSFSCLA